MRVNKYLSSLLRSRRRKQRVGLTISGGGARADFEIGALRYLYDRVQIAPQVIVGTSAGSLLSAVLAQSSDPADQRRLLNGLEEIWRGLKSSDEIFTPNVWFDILRRRGLEWADAQRKRQQMQLGFSHTLARVTHRPLPDAHRSDSSIGVVEVLSALRELGRASPELESLLRSMTQERSMYRLGPVMEQILGKGVFDPTRLAGAGTTLRIATVSLESGKLRYVTEKGILVDTEDRPITDEEGRPIDDEPVDLTDAIRASCAIPAVFEPVQLGTDHYVDGGVRENLPTRMTIEQLGVTTCYAIVANPLGVPPMPSFAGADMLSVAMRATAEIMPDEEAQDEIDTARRDGAVVILPELNLHDVLTVDPGLTAMSMDYGYLRAAEAVQGLGAEQSRLIRDTIALRRQIWDLEQELFLPGPGTAADAPPAIRWFQGTQTTAAQPAVAAELPDLTELGEHKRRLRDLVAQLPEDVRPPGAEDWWQRFEGHTFEVPAEVDWV